MKKLFFSAMACIAFAGSAFASNEGITSFKACSVTLAIEDSDSELGYTLNYNTNYDVKTLEDCYDWAKQLRENLKQKGLVLIGQHVIFS